MQSMPGAKSQPCSLYGYARVYGNEYSVDMEDSIVKKTRRRGSRGLEVSRCWRKGMRRQQRVLNGKNDSQYAASVKAECCSDKTERTSPLQYGSLGVKDNRTQSQGHPISPFALGVDETTFLQIVHHQYSQLRLRSIVKRPSGRVIEMEGRIHLY